MNCDAIVKEMFEAFSREDWESYDRWVFLGVKKCDKTPGQLHEEMGRRYAELIGKNMTRELIGLYIVAALAGSQKPRAEAITAVALRYSPLLQTVECEVLAKVVAGMVNELKDTPIWEGPVWPAASQFIYLLERNCGEVPDEIVEALGAEEYAQYAASREEGAAVVKYPDSVVRIAWKDKLL
jgi:hypothetical protein